MSSVVSRRNLLGPQVRSSSSLGTDLIEALLATALEWLPVSELRTDLPCVLPSRGLRWPWMPSPAGPLPSVRRGVLPLSQTLSSMSPNSHATAGDSVLACKMFGASRVKLCLQPCFTCPAWHTFSCSSRPRGAGLRSQPLLQLAAADTHFFTCSAASGSRRHAARSKATESSAVASVRTSGVYPTRIPLQGKQTGLWGNAASRGGLPQNFWAG